MATPTMAREPLRLRERKSRAQTAAQRLERALASWKGNRWYRLIDACERIGVHWRVAMRAKNGRDINASAYLTLCAAVGIDPLNGKRCAPREQNIEVTWWIVGAGLVLARAREDMNVRDLAAALRISITTISRVENAKPIGVDALLAVIRFIDMPVERFTCDGGNAVSKSNQQVTENNTA